MAGSGWKVPAKAEGHQKIGNGELIVNQKSLEKYAQVLIQVGINLKAGEFIQINGDTDSLPLIRQVVRAAWQAGDRKSVV